jgi:hypothetical protein
MAVFNQFMAMINSLSDMVGQNRIGVGIKIFSELEDKDVGDLNALISTINGGYTGKANLVEDSISWLDLKYIQEELQKNQVSNSITTEVKQTLNKLDNSSDLLSSYGAKLQCSGVSDFLPEFVQSFAQANSLCEETAKTNIQIGLQARKEKIEQVAFQIISELESPNKSCPLNYYVKSDNPDTTTGNFRQKLTLIGNNIDIKTLTAEECNTIKTAASEQRDTKKIFLASISSSALASGGGFVSSLGGILEDIISPLTDTLIKSYGNIANLTTNLEQGALSFNLNTILGYDLNEELTKATKELDIAKLEQDFT